MNDKLTRTDFVLNQIPLYFQENSIKIERTNKIPQFSLVTHLSTRYVNQGELHGLAVRLNRLNIENDTNVRYELSVDDGLLKFIFREFE